MIILTSLRLITEWRIQKRVEEQFNAFITGFHELIPADLITVFDDRELELLIGGIADIDVDDWKKHTDYRGYTESDEVIQNFWKVRIPCLLRYSIWMLKPHSSASVAGTPSRSRVYFSSPLVPRVFLSTDSRICRVAMVPGDSQSRRRVKLVNCRSLTLGKCPILSPFMPWLIIGIASTAWTFRLTSRTRRSTRSSRSPLRRR